MGHYISHAKSGILACIISIIGTLSPFNTALCSEDILDEELREYCVAILKDGHNYEGDFWTNVHAAEALLWNVYFEGVKENFVFQGAKYGKFTDS